MTKLKYCPICYKDGDRLEEHYTSDGTTAKELFFCKTGTHSKESDRYQPKPNKK